LIDKRSDPPAAGTLAACGCAIAYALCYALVSGAQWSTWTVPPTGIVESIMLAFLVPPLLLLVQRLVWLHLLDPIKESSAAAVAVFSRWEPLTYAILPAGVLLFARNGPSLALTAALLTATWLVQAALFAAVLPGPDRDRLVTSRQYVVLLFLVSGFSALIYQVVWQRVLFRSFGVNSESVTIIVSVFMFGLGVGALCGGLLQQRFPQSLLRIFLALEIGIGLFGLASLELISVASQTPPGASLTVLALRVYSVLAIPTLLMGATLPVLVSFLQKHLRNIGRAVGLLYAFNTVGSAIAAFATVQMLFVLAGLKISVLVAACCNFVTAFLIWHASRRMTADAAAQGHEEEGKDEVAHGGAASTHVTFPVAFALLAAIGFISLSHEILWFRLLGYLSGSRPQVFGLLLAAFLVGIALGSLRASTRCESGADIGRTLLRALMAAGVVFYLAFPLIAEASALLGTPVGLALGYLAVGTVAYFCGGILPLLMHIASQRAGGSGLSVSLLYFGNIVGATLGPLVTGFVLLDMFSLDVNVALLSALTLALVVVLAFVLGAARRDFAGAWRMTGLVVSIAGAGWFAHAALFSGYLEKMLYASTGEKPFLHSLENRSGILAVEQGSNTMYGDGMYDGRFNTDPVRNNNGIDRAYMIAGLHREPKRVLEIGLSTGSWTRVMSSYRPIQEMKVVEINKGYPAIVRHFPDIARVLDDPRIEHIVDDGRRWLRNHEDERFDLIVMNTSYHWRSNMTNLLSAEFLTACREHLLPGGVLYYNATGSDDVLYTAARVFRHVTKYGSFVAASDSPFDIAAEVRRSNLLRFQTLLGEPVLGGAARRELLERLSQHPLPELRDALLRRTDLTLITDDGGRIQAALTEQYANR
jgi:spermidine synthase